MIPLIISSTNKDSLEIYITNLQLEKKYSKTNVLEIFPLKSEITIAQVRELKKQIAVYSPAARLVIFNRFDTATLEAQNSLLKSLEENIFKTQFVLSVSNEYKILPTIRSRANIVKLNSRPKEEVDQEFNSLLKKLELDNYKFVAQLSSLGSTKDEVLLAINKLILFFRTKLVQRPKSAKVISKGLQIKALIESNNLNPQLALDNLLIFIFKMFRMDRNE